LRSVMNSANDLPNQAYLNQEKISSFKPPKPLVLFAAALLIALVAGIGGYLLGNRNEQFIHSLQPSASPESPIITQVSSTVVNSSSITTKQPISPQLSDRFANWKTYTSSHGYSVRYPSDMEHEEIPNGYPFDLRIKSKDFTILFMLKTLPHGKTVEDLATKSVCGDRPNDFKIKEEKINNILIYRVEETLGNNRLCLQAIIGLNTFLIHPHGPEQWILEIHAHDINRYSAKLFDDILSTVRLTP
jgi:hypothetical protein